MLPIQSLDEMLQNRFPKARVVIDEPAREDGNWFLDFADGDCLLTIEWRNGQGFGLSRGGTGGFGEGPDEVYPDEEATFGRIVSLVLSGGVPSPPDAVRLRELRQSRGVSQVDLAATMQKQQAAISKLERRSNIQINTLRDVVEAMGGRLQVLARFPDGLQKQLCFDDDEVGSRQKEVV